jgi:hypothetical protein
MNRLFDYLVGAAKQREGKDGTKCLGGLKIDDHFEFVAGRSHVAKGTVINADEAGSWDELRKRYEVKRINHEEGYSMDGACTNWAEECFSRMRRAEIGIHHHIAGQYLLRYAQESSWREDNRRISNGDQVQRLAALAMKRRPSVDFSGYWQRHKEEAAN